MFTPTAAESPESTSVAPATPARRKVGVRVAWGVGVVAFFVVLGVGLARGIGALDLRVVGTIAMSWVVTLPTGAGLAVFFFYFFKGLLSD